MDGNACEPSRWPTPKKVRLRETTLSAVKRSSRSLKGPWAAAEDVMYGG